jgi:hypothetical protein
MTSLRGRGAGMTVLFGVVGLLVLADVGFAAMLAVRHTESPAPLAAGQANPAGHPCNHGYYVSQAARAHKGGGYVSGIAQSDLGKNGDCSAPLPSRPPSPSGASPKDS